MTKDKKQQKLSESTEPAIAYSTCYPQCFLNEVACVDWEDGIKQVFDNTIDLVLTDPPYGMAYRSNR